MTLLAYATLHLFDVHSLVIMMKIMSLNHANNVAEKVLKVLCSERVDAIRTISYIPNVRLLLPTTTRPRAHWS